MKLLFLLLISSLIHAQEIYKYKLATAEKDFDLSSLKNKTVLIVNIATRCGYTGQLDGLEKLYSKYKNKNFVVIGIPTNDFGEQTPEENKEVVKFCKLKFGVNFPVTNKIVVKGENKHPLYKYLTSITNNEEIGWNFTKFLISKEGKLIKRFGSSTTPDSEELNGLISKSL